MGYVCEFEVGHNQEIQVEGVLKPRTCYIKGGVILSQYTRLNMPHPQSFLLLLSP